MHRGSGWKFALCYFFWIIFTCGTLHIYSDAQNPPQENKPKEDKPVEDKSNDAGTKQKEDISSYPGPNWVPTTYSNYSSKYFMNSMKSETEEAPVEIEPQKNIECDTRLLSEFTRNIASGYTSEKPVPPDYIEEEKTFQYGSKTVHNEWGEFLDQYPSLKLLVIFILILAILIPVIGLIFCCCRRAGKCGTRADSCDKKYDRAMRLCCSILLILLVLLITPFLIYAFISYFYLLRGLNGLEDGKYGRNDEEGSKVVEGDPQDMARDLQKVKKHINKIFKQNYGEFHDNLENNIRDEIEFIASEQKKHSAGNSTIFMKNYVSTLTKVSTAFNELQNFIDKCMELEDGLRHAKRRLIRTIVDCQNCPKPFLDAYTDFGKLDLKNPGFDMVTFSDYLAQLRSGLNTMNVEAANASKNYKAIDDRLHQVKKAFVDDVWDTFRIAGVKLGNIGYEMKAEIHEIYEDDDDDNKSLGGRDDRIPSYVLVFGFIVCCIILLILICVIAAVVCGICGKRRNESTSKCYNRDIGSRLLILAAYLIFIFFVVIALTLLKHLLLGTAAYRAICYSLNHAEFSSTSDNQANIIEKNRTTFICPPGKNIYQALRQVNRFRDIREINKLAEEYDATPKISVLDDYLGYERNDTYLYAPYEMKLMKDDPWHEITKAEFDQQLDPKDYFAIEINDMLAKIDGFGNLVNETAQNVVKSTMQLLTTMKNKVVSPLINENLPNCAKQIVIVENLKFAGQSPLAFSKDLIKELEDTQTHIQTHMKSLANLTAENLKKNCKEEFIHYLNRTVELVETTVGVCKPKVDRRQAEELPHLAEPKEAAVEESITEPSDTAQKYLPTSTLSLPTSTSTLTTQDAVCYCIVDPLNAFWLALLLCLLLLLPILLIIPFLAYLYRKPCPYGESPESFLRVKRRICECAIDDLDDDGSFPIGGQRYIQKFKPNEKVEIDCKSGRIITIRCDQNSAKDEGSRNLQYENKSRFNSRSCKREHQTKSSKMSLKENITTKKIVLMNFEGSGTHTCPNYKLKRVVTIKCDPNKSENKSKRYNKTDESDNIPSGSGYKGNTRKRVLIINRESSEKVKQLSRNIQFEDGPSGSIQCKCKNQNTQIHSEQKQPTNKVILRNPEGSTSKENRKYKD